MILCANVKAVEIIHYDNKPVTILLHVGEERTIQFSDHVQVGMTKGQQVKKLFRVQSAQGAVHFLPYKEFQKQRIQIKRLGDSRVVLLDLVSTKPSLNSQTLEPIDLLLDIDNVTDAKHQQMANQEKATAKAPITPITLTRYASQKLYGPTRLHKTPRGVSETQIEVKDAVKVFRGENKFKTIAEPLMAFRGGAHYLTALHIRNLHNEAVQLNYLDLNLPFSHVTFQHHKLSPAGTAGDSTVMYLVSEEPMREVLYPWTYYKDAVAEAKEKERQRQLEATKKAKHVNNKTDWRG